GIRDFHVTGVQTCALPISAYSAAKGLGIPGEEAARHLMSFPGLAHRMETVGVLGKVRFINDSKATNADAARQALSSYPKVYWIRSEERRVGKEARLLRVSR